MVISTLEGLLSSSCNLHHSDLVCVSRFLEITRACNTWMVPAQSRPAKILLRFSVQSCLGDTWFTHSQYGSTRILVSSWQHSGGTSLQSRFQGPEGSEGLWPTEQCPAKYCSLRVMLGNTPLKHVTKQTFLLISGYGMSEIFSFWLPTSSSVLEMEAAQI